MDVELSPKFQEYVYGEVPPVTDTEKVYTPPDTVSTMLPTVRVPEAATVIERVWEAVSLEVSLAYALVTKVPTAVGLQARLAAFEEWQPVGRPANA